MNSIRIQLLKRTHAEETFGFVTKEHRQLMGLPKEHYFDAVAIATQGEILPLKRPTSCLKNAFLTVIINKPKVFVVNKRSPQENSLDSESLTRFNTKEKNISLKDV